MTPRFAGLWRNPPFVLLWTGSTVSQLGSQVTLIALPLTAILMLNASPVQVGLLTAAGFGPGMLFGLLAGVWVDRVRRRPLLIGCQLVLAAVTLWVPIASWLGMLRLEQLFVLEAVGGSLAVLSSAASQAYVPHLVGIGHVVEANAKLETARSVTRVIGPGLAGALVQLLSAATAMLVDALSFAICALCLLWIRVPESAPAAAAHRGVWQEIQEGLYLVARHRLIRPLLMSMALYNGFAAAFVAVYALFMVRDLGLDPLAIGVIISGGGIGGILGGLIAERTADRLGIGRAIIGGSVLLAVAHFAAPLAFGGPGITVPLLFGAAVLAQFSLVMSSVNQTSLVQQLVPPYVLGRVSATQGVVKMAIVPFGAIAGGFVGEALGLRFVVAVAAVGTTVAMLLLLLSPLSRRLDLTPVTEADAGADSQTPRPAEAVVLI